MREADAALSSTGRGWPDESSHARIFEAAHRDDSDKAARLITTIMMTRCLFEEDYPREQVYSRESALSNCVICGTATAVIDTMGFNIAKGTKCRMLRTPAFSLCEKSRVELKFS